MDLGHVRVIPEEGWQDGPPHELFKEMRGTCPVHWSDGIPAYPSEAGYWSVTRAEDVEAVSRDWETYSSASGITVVSDAVIPVELISAMFIGMDPPKHDRLKNLFQRGFTPKRIGEHEEQIRAITVEALDRLDGRERCDLVSEVAQPVVSRVIGSFMGIPPEDFTLENLIKRFDPTSNDFDPLFMLQLNIALNDPNSPLNSGAFFWAAGLFQFACHPVTGECAPVEDKEPADSDSDDDPLERICRTLGDCSKPLTDVCSARDFSITVPPPVYVAEKMLPPFPIVVGQDPAQRGVDVRAGRQPFPGEDGLAGGRHRHHHVRALHGGARLIHGLYPGGDQRLHLADKLGALFGAAAIDAHLLDGPHRADGQQLGARLAAGPEQAQGFGLRPGHVLGGHAAGRPGAHLPQVVGFQQGQQPAGLGAVERHQEVDAAGDDRVDLQAQHALAGQGAGHVVQQAILEGNASAGMVEAACAGGQVTEGRLHRLQRQVQRQQGLHVAFGQQPGHRASRVGGQDGISAFEKVSQCAGVVSSGTSACCTSCRPWPPLRCAAGAIVRQGKRKPASSLSMRRLGPGLRRDDVKRIGQGMRAQTSCRKYLVALSARPGPPASFPAPASG